MKELQYTAEQIAQALGGVVEGNASAIVSGFANIEEAGAGQLTFLSNPKYEPHLYTTGASIVLVNSDLVLREAVSVTLIRVPNAYAALAQLMQIVDQETRPRYSGIDPRAIVQEGVTLGKDVYIGAGAVIEAGAVVGDGVQIYPNSYIGQGSELGEGTIIYPNVTIYHGITIGQRCIIHAGAVIGADGFGFAPKLDGYGKIPQLGNVIIEDDVEIGANTCIDRATLSSTIIRRGAKLDNLVQVAHNCQVGAHTVMAAQGGMAGSSSIGSWCQTGGQVGIAGHLKIGDRVQLGGQTGVIGNLKSDQQLLGSPAMDARQAMRIYATMGKLPDMYKQIALLEKEIEKLKHNTQA